MDSNFIAICGDLGFPLSAKLRLVMAFIRLFGKTAIDAQGPKDAVVDSNDNEPGKPAARLPSCTGTISLCFRYKFSSAADSNDNVVRVDSNLNLEFNVELNKSACNVPTIWKVEFNASMQQWLVTIGGDRSHNRFQITRACPYRKYFYQLRYCPYLGSIQFPCVTVCSLFKNGLSYLALNGDPIQIVLGQLGSST
ncbi:KUNITZ TRYPSIN INHIBITOR 2 [Salix koriyanagi]|uniref:KUNITZ TRYPSIN INHIBITOR 2 n=1 Tax=Salix koriyanagi TaxID=2511006 RepID=A0A9Q0T070_9ROSI|nr:KUNITZ TRYPSIN INHIBITOR 2 [Salix koriyanagi]